MTTASRSRVTSLVTFKLAIVRTIRTNFLSVLRKEPAIVRASFCLKKDAKNKAYTAERFVP